MLAPLNEYYTDEEYEFALRQMYRMMERNRIYTMATVILKEKNSLQTNYKEKVRESAEETKVAIGKINIHTIFPSLSSIFLNYQKKRVSFFYTSLYFL